MLVSHQFKKRHWIHFPCCVSNQSLVQEVVSFSGGHTHVVKMFAKRWTKFFRKFSDCTIKTFINKPHNHRPEWQHGHATAGVLLYYSSTLSSFMWTKTRASLSSQSPPPPQAFVWTACVHRVIITRGAFMIHAMICC